MKELSEARRDLSALYPDYSILVSCILARHKSDDLELLSTEYSITIIEACAVLLQERDSTIANVLQKVLNKMTYLHK